ncbi:glutathione S-transferase C-terminal-like protein [Lanmaoa asiatica]|nr:glutathione S-transferase C-terminal-like protein [Lanmaoa asiatica]
MAPIGSLWGNISQRQTKVILSVAALNDLELVLLPEFDLSNKPKEFVTKFAYGKIPAFEHSEGWKLLEGAPIARYLSDVGGKVSLLGSDAKEAALVDQWVHFAEHEIGVPTQVIFGLIYGFAGPFNRETFDKKIERLGRALTYLESYLATRSSGYLVMDTMSLADVVIAGVILDARRVSLGIAEIAQYPNVFAHFAKVTEDERVKQFWGAGRWPFVDVAVTEPRPLPSA